MSPEPKRTHRVGQLIQQELAKMLVDGVKDPRVGFATVTEVRVAPDLRTARVYVSVYGSDEQRSDSLKGLEAASGYLKRELGRRLSLKYTPSLSFTFDDSLDRADRLEALLGAVARGDAEAPPEGVAEVVPVETSRSGMAERQREFEAAPPPKKERRTRRRKRRP